MKNLISKQIIIHYWMIILFINLYKVLIICLYFVFILFIKLCVQVNNLFICISQYLCIFLPYCVIFYKIYSNSRREAYWTNLFNKLIFFGSNPWWVYLEMVRTQFPAVVLKITWFGARLDRSDFASYENIIIMIMREWLRLVSFSLWGEARNLFLAFFICLIYICIWGLLFNNFFL